jgi:hypothetical protein
MGGVLRWYYPMVDSVTIDHTKDVPSRVLLIEGSLADIFASGDDSALARAVRRRMLESNKATNDKDDENFKIAGFNNVI